MNQVDKYPQELNRSSKSASDKLEWKRECNEAVVRRKCRGASGTSKNVVNRGNRTNSRLHGKGVNGSSHSNATIDTSETPLKNNTGVVSEDTDIPNNSIGSCSNTSASSPPSIPFLHGCLKDLGDPNNFVYITFAEYHRFYEQIGPIRFQTSLENGLKSSKAEVRLWHDENTSLISQNSTQRKVCNAYLLPKMFANVAMRVALKYVEDSNLRDCRSIKREIECHMYIYHKLMGQQHRNKMYNRDWPCAEILCYYLENNAANNAVLVMRKLSGPDFFDIIRSEYCGNVVAKNQAIYEFNKLDWCITALERIVQLNELGVRHNDIKPDNIVLDVYYEYGIKKVDVKLIDLGAASMEFTPEFTGGTNWYESPEQKLLRYYTEKHRNLAMGKLIGISRASDAWGAGISIVEVLLGRRIVDSFRSGKGPGLMEPTNLPCDPLDLCALPHKEPWWNRPEYWEIPPQEWINHVAKILGLYEDSRKPMLCTEAARFVFEHLVQINPNKRSSVRFVAAGLRQMVTGAISYHL
ncbi:bifunctional Protein kinase domain/Serine-threonine-protein kinase [Babesia duncani]|uniref:Bifunctional Protein kinase domain/Serine-threonine-protein kinase n=1 Tax=Babesia duncani TaxID=323732 RepID=A0AAD9PLL4_9APIC|nr:bifunctional Protein kinase domain/Serine-threonine-protein kinase [Babesia duncani]